MAPPGVNGTTHVVSVELTANGDVSDYDDAKKQLIAEVFAAELAGVLASDIIITVEPASVRITVTIPLANSAQASAASTTLAAKISDEASATAFLSAASVVVEAVDSLPVSVAEDPLSCVAIGCFPTRNGSSDARV